MINARMLAIGRVTHLLANVVIPHSRFLKYQERRRSIAAELTPRDGPGTIDADLVSVAVEAASPETLNGHNAERQDESRLRG